jgi:hypothetical protein
MSGTGQGLRTEFYNKPSNLRARRLRKEAASPQSSILKPEEKSAPSGFQRYYACALLRACKNNKMN